MAYSSFSSLLSFALLASAVSAGTYSGQFVAPPARNATTVTRRAGNGLINMGYFANWASAESSFNFKANDIPIETLTHILYAFGDCDKASGALKLSDPTIDTGDSASGTLGGQLGDLFALKQKQRNLKVIMSFGGWTYSQDGHFDFVIDATARAKFVADSIQWIEDYGLDGIDIDYEALTAEQTDGFISLMKELREALDKHAADKGDDTGYLLTSAVGYAPADYVSQAAQYMDYYNIMDYDFSGSWIPTTQHQANLYSDGSNGGVSIDSGVQKWLGVVPAEKLVIGQPLYARAFAKTTGIGAAYDGMAGNEGIMNYKDLPSSGDTVVVDEKLGASYSFDPATGILASYDVPAVTKIKAKYIQDKGLAGSMWWDLSTDKVGEDSLVGLTAKIYGSLDQTKNHINYPKSAYDNVKAAGAGEQGGSGGGEQTSDPIPEPTATATATPTETPAPGPTKTCAAKKRSTA
ncbi:hypothetical protein EXIGLDRAFT_834532 [Exidia glandulosa HHB12029]|uniref:GH18 domain-containing protein n=1 Tax=Exidia glandulosa HHB12029 TaxID=1314781 RepID=A0A165JPQ0_EXIGL|nr:hypothetical protein EXIGLDRAFT_834532 [Exidia glandulosa HHB12029]